MLTIWLAHYLIVTHNEGYVIAVVSIMVAASLAVIWLRSDKAMRKQLVLVFCLMLFGIVFWVFDQQIGSSIPLFIERNIQKTLFGFYLPASVFVAFNSAAILVGGAVVAWVFSRMKSSPTQLKEMLKFSLGLLGLTLSFMLLFIGAKLATLDGLSSPIWVILALSMIGLSELFIDPLAMSQITKIDSKHTGFLAASYMLFTGSVANFLAAKVAQTSSFVEGGGAGQFSIMAQAKLYEQLFVHISLICLLTFILWLGVAYLFRKQ